MRRYKNLLKGENPNPDDEIIRQINPVFMRVCGLLNCMVRQEYDKITCLKGLK